MRSNFVFQEIWVGLRRNLTMTVALIVVVAISLSLLGTGLLFVKQVDRTRTYWQSQVEISVYLCYKGDINPNCHGAITPAQQQQLTSTLTNEQSLVSTVTASELPPSLEIKLRNPSADYQIVASAVQGAAGVDSVIDEMTILQKFYSLLTALRKGGGAGPLSSAV